MRMYHPVTDCYSHTLSYKYSVFVFEVKCSLMVANATSVISLAFLHALFSLL